MKEPINMWIAYIQSLPARGALARLVKSAMIEELSTYLQR